VIPLLLVLLVLQDEARLGEEAYRAGRFEEAAGHLLKAAERPPASAATWRAAGHACLKAKRTADATRCFRTAAGLDPSGGDGIWLARLALEAKHPREAEQELRGYLASRPDAVDGLELLGYLQAGEGRPAEAALTYARLSALRPLDARYRSALAQAEAARGRHGEAIDALEAALRLGEREPAAWRLLADLYLNRGMPREAARAYARASADPGPEDWYRLGLAREAAGEPASAREAFERAGAGHGPSLVRLARLAVAGSDADAARRACEAAMKAAPKDPLPAEWLGDLELRLGRAREAAAAYAEALRRGDERPELFARRAAALQQHGELKPALDAVREGLRLHPLDERLRGLARGLFVREVGR
jgi:predicted Zn-dependent protease